ncbi:hypothetical protein ACHAXT_006168 [Thalassiosira profunda]
MSLNTAAEGTDTPPMPPHDTPPPELGGGDASPAGESTQLASGAPTAAEVVDRLVLGRKRPRPRSSSASSLQNGDKDKSSGNGNASRVLWEMAREVDDIFREVMPEVKDPDPGDPGSPGGDIPPILTEVGNEIRRLMLERDGGGGDDESMSISWTQHVDCLLGLWAICLGKNGSLTDAKKQLNDDEEGTANPKIVPRALSPDGQFFPFLIDRILVRVRTIADNFPSRLVADIDDEGEASLEEQCLLVILQTLISSVMLDESRSEWHAIFYNLIRAGDVTAGQARALHEAAYHLINPRWYRRAEEEGIEALFAAMAMTKVSLFEAMQLQAKEVPSESKLPLPLFPFIGCGKPLSVGVSSDVSSPAPPLTGPASEALQSELIWLGPQYPTNRLALMSPHDDPVIQQKGAGMDSANANQGADEKDAEIVDILKNRAFAVPLPPRDERKVLDALTGADVADANGKPAEDGGKVVRRGKKSKARSKRTPNSTQQPLALGGPGRKRALRLVAESSLAPKTLPRLVEANPAVAVECLVLILTAPAEEGGGIAGEKNDYLSALVGMEMSIHSMEVVNRLATQTAQGGENGESEPLLHPEYVHLYISTCISACEGMGYDRHLQNKSVRLLCVFLQSLLGNGIVTVEDLFVEAQSFCIEFSRIREAAALFQMLKSK